MRFELMFTEDTIPNALWRFEPKWLINHSHDSWRSFLFFHRTIDWLSFFGATVDYKNPHGGIRKFDFSEFEKF